MLKLSKSESDKKSRYSTSRYSFFPPFSAGQSDESEVSNLKICIVIALPRFFCSVVKKPFHSLRSLFIPGHQMTAPECLDSCRVGLQIVSTSNMQQILKT